MLAMLAGRVLTSAQGQACFLQIALNDNSRCMHESTPAYMEQRWELLAVPEGGSCRCSS